MFDVGVAVSLRVPDQVQRGARPQVLPVRQLLADHDACGSAGSSRRPASTLTRSSDKPSPPAGPASAVRPENGEAPGPGSDICRKIAEADDDTCGRRAMARK